ncbi:MBL fold metallo-hydrolase [Clostridium sp. SHJSY1]|uniref:ComEC/Rec2 family competence protein n=1 Tax=Clostridium sp. SHJSY1 TaxID=2942483 RepID=UPI002874040E|nr:MBL fold metallo-hydrolase [Clostridium sp. SHJSY1]MDS0525429.1 MBL fold metallo-hydrolase [Clostridium sp. SHJSY1]
MGRTIFRICGLIALIFLLLGAIYIVKGQNKVSDYNADKIEVSFLKLKNDADSILMQNGNQNVLIDTGEKEDAEDVIAYLKSKEVSEIQCLILTHYDKDHIGGAEAIINNFTVKNIIRPYYNKDGKEYTDLINKIEEKNIITTIPTKISNYTVGDINLRVYPPLKKEYADDNNYSLVTLANYKDINILFAGDAVKKRSEELLNIDWPKINIYKVPHHGRANSNSKELINSIKPDYAVVTSKDADATIKDACEEEDTKLIFTGAGTITFSSDGSKVVLDK